MELKNTKTKFCYTQVRYRFYHHHNSAVLLPLYKLLLIHNSRISHVFNCYYFFFLLAKRAGVTFQYQSGDVGYIYQGNYE